MTELSTPSILRIDASGRYDGSASRALSSHLVEQLTASHPDASVTVRDLAPGLPFVDAEWIGANFTPADARTDAQNAILTLSDGLIAEIEAADILVIGTPIYNFGPPAVLKAWIDMVARAGKTFRYTENGPVGLLEGKKAYVAIASGGTEMGSEIDFLSGYFRHFLGFIGINDVEFFAADQMMMRGEERVDHAKAAIEAAL